MATILSNLISNSTSNKTETKSDNVPPDYVYGKYCLETSENFDAFLKEIGKLI